MGDNGSGSMIHREFCGDCGSYICEYGVISGSLRGLLVEVALGVMLIGVV